MCFTVKDPLCGLSRIPTKSITDGCTSLRDRGEAPVLFEACIVLLSSTLDKLHAELERQLNTYFQEDDREGQDGSEDGDKSSQSPAPFDLALGVRLAEAGSQVGTCSSYHAPVLPLSANASWPDAHH